MKLTRRELAALASAAIASAQTQPPAAADELTAARDRLKANSSALAQTELPAATEPAFRFEP